MKSIIYTPVGVCSKFMELEADENQIITNAKVIGGCNGNLKGICSLIIGMDIDTAAKKMCGIHCGSKPTSCPDQMSTALRKLQALYSKNDDKQ